MACQVKPTADKRAHSFKFVEGLIRIISPVKKSHVYLTQALKYLWEDVPTLSVVEFNKR
jgi:hypothetical protein